MSSHPPVVERERGKAQRETEVTPRKGGGVTKYYPFNGRMKGRKK